VVSYELQRGFRWNTACFLQHIYIYVYIVDTWSFVINSNKSFLICLFQEWQQFTNVWTASMQNVPIKTGREHAEHTHIRWGTTTWNMSYTGKNSQTIDLTISQERSMSSLLAGNWTELLHLHLHKTTWFTNTVTQIVKHNWIFWIGYLHVMNDEQTEPTLQWNFLWQTAASRCEVFLTFRELTPSPSSGCACVGTELVTKMSEKLHIFTWLSAWENFIEFCCCKCFKT
jgi:hypothetical protein